MARILVVEDEPTVRDLVMRMLQVLGHRAYGAENGMAALEVLDEIAVDLVLSDQRMPVMNGGALLGALRARGNQTPFVFMSGHCLEASPAPFMPDDFIAKPFLLNDLKAVIHRTLAERTAV